MAELVVAAKVAMVVHFNTVGFKIYCGDSYEAQVAYDEFQEAMKRGDKIVIDFEDR